MTSSVYVDTSTGSTYERIRYPNAGPSYVWQSGLQLNTRFTESRPESLHSLKDSSGVYKEQLPWTHSKSYATSGSSYVLGQDMSGRTAEVNCAGRIYYDPISSPEQAIADYAVQKALAGIGEPLMQMRVFFRELEKAVNSSRRSVTVSSRAYTASRHYANALLVREAICVGSSAMVGRRFLRFTLPIFSVLSPSGMISLTRLIGSWT